MSEAVRVSIDAPGAPSALGPYSHAVRAGGFVFCSGQVPLDPTTGELVAGDVSAQARQSLANLATVCAGAGVRLVDAARVTVYLVDMADFPAVNEVYAEAFAEADGYPARVTVAVAGLPAGARVEIDAVVPAG